MKFKALGYTNDKEQPMRGITIIDKAGDELRVETRMDSKSGLFIAAEAGMLLTKSKALKLAWAMIDELDPTDEYRIGG
jgi:hypothetical protein